MSKYRELYVFAVLLFFGCSSEIEGPHCSAKRLSQALDRALYGETVKIGYCVVDGHLKVPQGVTLSGATNIQGISLIGKGIREERSGFYFNPKYSVIESDGSDSILEVMSGSTLKNIVLWNKSSLTGVFVKDEQDVSFQDIEIRTEHGVAFSAEAVSGMRLSNVVLLGPVNVDNVDYIPPDPSGDVIATHGMFLSSVMDVTAENISIKGFAKFGLLSLDSEISLSKGESFENRGSNMVVLGGHAKIEDFRFNSSMQGINIVPSYGFAVGEDASIEAYGVIISENQGIGLFHESSSESTYQDITASDNLLGGLWVTQSDSVNILDSLVKKNNRIGIAVLHSTNVSIDSGDISESELVKYVNDRGRIECGDGIQIVEPFGEISLKNLTLSNSERVQLLLHLGCKDIDFEFHNISVSGTGNQLGVIAQQDETCKVLPNEWKKDFYQDDTTLLNDENHELELETLL